MGAKHFKVFADFDILKIKMLKIGSLILIFSL